MLGLASTPGTSVYTALTLSNSVLSPKKTKFAGETFSCLVEDNVFLSSSSSSRSSSSYNFNSIAEEPSVMPSPSKSPSKWYKPFSSNKRSAGISKLNPGQQSDGESYLFRKPKDMPLEQSKYSLLAKSPARTLDSSSSSVPTTPENKWKYSNNRGVSSPGHSLKSPDKRGESPASSKSSKSPAKLSKLGINLTSPKVKKFGVMKLGGSHKSSSSKNKSLESLLDIKGKSVSSVVKNYFSPTYSPKKAVPKTGQHRNNRPWESNSSTSSTEPLSLADSSGSSNLSRKNEHQSVPLELHLVAGKNSLERKEEERRHQTERTLSQANKESFVSASQFFGKANDRSDIDDVDPVSGLTSSEASRTSGVSMRASNISKFTPKKPPRPSLSKGRRSSIGTSNTGVKSSSSSRCNQLNFCQSFY
jgi:hypothetical protein